MSNHHVGGGIYQINRAIYLLYLKSHHDLLFRHAGVAENAQKFIAHCTDEEKNSLGDLVDRSLPSQIILIGPEGDFSQREIDLAAQLNFIPVSLGHTRLRAETAGVVAAALMR